MRILNFFLLQRETRLQIIRWTRKKASLCGWAFISHKTYWKRLNLWMDGWILFANPSRGKSFEQAENCIALCSSNWEPENLFIMQSLLSQSANNSDDNEWVNRNFYLWIGGTENIINLRIGVCTQNGKLKLIKTSFFSLNYGTCYISQARINIYLVVPVVLLKFDIYDYYVRIRPGRVRFKI